MRKKLINKNKIKTISENMAVNERGHLMHIATKKYKGVNIGDPGVIPVKVKGEYNPKTDTKVINIINKKSGIVKQAMNPYHPIKEPISTSFPLESFHFKKQKKKATLPKKVK